MRAVAFDCDGVIVDSEPLAERAWSAGLATFGYHMTPDDVEACLGVTERDSYRYFAERVSLPSYDAVMGVVDGFRRSLYEDRLEAFPDAVETIRSLAGEGIPLAVASSSRRGPLEWKLDRFDLRRYFTTIVSGDDVERGKPAPDVYLAAVEGLGVPATDVLAIEDAVNGAEAATAAGLRVVIVDRSGGLRPGFATVSAVDLHTVRSWLGLG